MNFGSNSFIWILLIFLLMPNCFGGCGDNSFLILILLIMMMQSNGCGICDNKGC